jgi:hypothetical protein
MVSAYRVRQNMWLRPETLKLLLEGRGIQTWDQYLSGLISISRTHLTDYEEKTFKILSEKKKRLKKR